MRRRDFLKYSALGGASLAFVGMSGGLFAANDWREAFRAGRRENAWAIGLRSVDTEHLDASLERLRGQIPANLRGTLYRNGPARHELGGRRYHHWFDGDGMVQAFRFTDHGVLHQGRYVQTNKHRAESKAGRFLRPAFGTRFPDTKPLKNRDAGNAANTNVVPHHGRLLALWEGGSAYAIDRDDLTTDGPVVWSDETAGLPFSAHPSVEADGTLWNFGLSAVTGQLILYEIAPSGTLRRAEAIALSDVPMVHDFVVTQRYLVFLMPPFHFRQQRFVTQKQSFLASHQWEPRKPTRALVVDKRDWSRRRWFELPPGFHFHLGGGWDEGQVVHLDYERYPDPSIVTDFAREIMRGRADSEPVAHTTAVRLDMARGTASQETLAERSEFPRIHPTRVGRRYRYRFSVTGDDDAHHPFQNALRRLDMETGAEDYYRFAATEIAEEHVVVPKPGRSHEAAAWLVGTVLDTRAERTRLTVFDAASIGDGPVFEAALPYALPLGLHGNFTTA